MIELFVWVTMKLVREFVKESLYHQSKGYFSRVDCVLSPDPIAFRELIGRSAYLRALNKAYKNDANRTSNAWLTPVELFKPWYSRAIARYIVQCHSQAACKGKSPLKIVEFGGGNGTNADSILQYLKFEHEELYNKSEYMLVDISPSMVQRQQDLLSLKHAQERFKVVNADFSEWNQTVPEPCYIVGLEVLDNLPHDKLVRRISDKTKEEWCLYIPSENDDWYQTMVIQDRETKEYREKLVPLTDELALQTAEAFLNKKPGQDKQMNLKSVIVDALSNPLEMLKASAKTSLRRERDRLERHAPGSKHRQVFIPTGAFQLMNMLYKYFPEHNLVLADFNELPAPELSMMTLLRTRTVPGSLQGCKNAPLVSSKDRDHASYLENPGEVDIFFQTDFTKLLEVYNNLGEMHRNEKSCKVIGSSEFLKSYGETAQTRTRTGYNPMIEDYANTSFFLSLNK